jgi:uncharacterized oxidoreductase
MQLSGHKVLITGGSAGIGRELARQLVARGNTVAICGRDLGKLEQAAAELGDVKTLQADLSRPTDVPALATAAAERLGGLSVLVNNAGVQYNYSFADAAPAEAAADAATEVQVNLTSVIALTAACLPRLRASESGAIVNISSTLALAPKAAAPVYCATKAAVHSFSQALRYQLEDSLPQIRVFEVMPPLVDTEMTRGRGSGKISPEQVAHETVNGMERNLPEIPVGKARTLRVIHRFAPSLAARILRNA